jgi:bacillithiol system protein YtxJ
LHPWADMDERFTPVKSRGELDALFERSRTEPIIIFKHDPYCSISSYAYGELLKVDGEIPWIDVAGDQPLSFAFAKMTGVEHESPQVVVLHDAKPVWAGSHWAIRADAVREACGWHNGHPASFHSPTR